MKYIVYLTINLLNYKFYIGIHKTENPEIFDGYLGNGAMINKPSSYNQGKEILHRALIKYGLKNFHRIVLAVYDTEQEAKYLEELLVNEKFIKRIDTYNCTTGGNIPPNPSKKVYQFTPKGKLIKVWDSVQSINQFYHTNHDRVYMCIRDKRSFKASFWSFDKHIDIATFKWSVNGEIDQYSGEGQFLHRFDNIKQASEQLDLDKQNLINAVYESTKLAGCYFFKPNADIEGFFKNKGKRPKYARLPVCQYDMNKRFIKEFFTQKEACQFLGVSTNTLQKHIKNQTLLNNSYWSFEKGEVLPDFIGIPKAKTFKIGQYDLNGNLIKVWNTSSECRKHFKACIKVCRGQRETCSGYKFKYIS